VPTELQRIVSLHLAAAACLSARTRRRLERALGRTAVVPTGSRDALRHAVGAAVTELLAAGVSPESVESTLHDVVAEAGVVHGAFTPSVVTQAPRWRDVEESVARWSRNDLAQMLHPEIASRARRQRR
jgi:hypothetical protein